MVSARLAIARRVTALLVTGLPALPVSAVVVIVAATAPVVTVRPVVTVAETAVVATVRVVIVVATAGGTVAGAVTVLSVAPTRSWISSWRS